MKKTFLAILLIAATGLPVAGKNYQLSSPNGEIQITLSAGDTLSCHVAYKGMPLFEECRLQLLAEGKGWEQGAHVTKTRRESVDGTLSPLFPLKASTVRNHYNQLQLQFKGGYGLEVRAFDNGMAYRFFTSCRDSVCIEDETLHLSFPGSYLLHLQQAGSFQTSYEEPYTHVTGEQWSDKAAVAVLPLLIDTQKGCKILTSESDVRDYPAMFFKTDGNNGLVSAFPKAPAQWEPQGDRGSKILEECSYIAKTTGTRNLPWRYFVISDDDAAFIENTMTFQLAGENALENTGWIRPGLASWEWWNGATPYGPDVDFTAGCNTATYKYFIDFAAHYGIPYILMDEGWAKDTRNPFIPNPNVDLHELIRYGKEKNVGILLWLTWLTVENHFDLFEKFSQWGIQGVKIDFMDRSDQWMVNFYERVAKEAAKHHLLVDFHGSFKPSGLEYIYPNILSYEGVRGMEQMGGCHPDNSLYLPFIRNAVGAMDYTPGAMLCMQPEVYASNRPNSASIGTRAYQMALYIVFESGLQMMADNPTLYYRNDECTRFITQIPQTWDETIALEAEAGEYAVTAKRKGNQWFVGGITNNRQTWRSFTIAPGFLEKGKTYRMVSFEDGTNAPRQAMDYRRKETILKAGDTFSIRLARNGGFAAIIEEIQ